VRPHGRACKPRQRALGRHICRHVDVGTRFDCSPLADGRGASQPLGVASGTRSRGSRR
jgi:hypothetical protein